MRLITFAAGTAAAIGAPAAHAGIYQLEVRGTVDHTFNAFDAPLDGISVGDSWSLKVIYDTDIPSQGANPFLQSFKNSLCAIELVVDGNTYDDSDFAGGTCDIIVTENPCPCGDVSGVQVDFVLPGGGIGFNLAITDAGGDFLPLMDLPTDQTDIQALAGDVQFEFFAPSTTGGTARALSTQADFIEITPAKPTPSTAAVLALAGIGAARRRRR